MFVILTGIAAGYLVAVSQLSKRFVGQMTETMMSLDRDERLAD